MKLINGVNKIIVFTDEKSEAKGIGLTLITDKKKYTRYYCSFAKLYIEAITYASNNGLYIDFDDVKLAKIFHGFLMVDVYQRFLDKLGKKRKQSVMIIPLVVSINKKLKTNRL